jgi:Flp pilus assembly protein TadD
LDPQPQLLTRRGLARAMSENFRGAVSDFERALQGTPPGSPLRRQLEEYLRQARAGLPR